MEDYSLAEMIDKYVDDSDTNLDMDHLKRVGKRALEK